MPYSELNSDDNEDSESTSSEEEEYFLSTDSPSDWTQHSFAIFIAVIASFVTFLYSKDYNITSFRDILRFGVEKEDSIPHHAAYRRTSHVHFCPLDSENDLVDGLKDNNLVPFDFRIQKHLVGSLLQLYDEDERASIKKNVEKNSHGLEDDGLTYPKIQQNCLEEKNFTSPKRFVIGHSVAYISPDVSTFYQIKRPKSEKAGRKIEEVAPSFTGFAAKFYNLSPKALDLWWDGGSGALKERKVGRIQPFESIGTATTPGQSFRFSPVYDGDHALIRFVATADDAVLVYDPQKHEKNDSRKEELSNAQKHLYNLARLNYNYEMDYFGTTKRPWLSAFPRPPPMHFMWKSDYFSQIHTIQSKETHFTSLPKKSSLKRLTYGDYYSKKKHQPYFPEHRNDVDAGMNMTLKVLSCRPRVFEIKNFLSEVEADHIIDLSTNNPSVKMEKSTTLGHNDASSPQEDIRNSSNAWVYRELDPIIDAVYRRASDLLRIDESLLRHRSAHERTELQTDHSIAEALQLLKYSPSSDGTTKGQSYAAHHDFHYPAAANRFQPTRFATLLLYLNDGFEGGKTMFPRAITADSHTGVEVTPEKGKAILFYNLLPDGNVDDLSQHSAEEVLGGNDKWLANLWVWDPIID